jgi:hypothetical protein
VKGYQMQLYFTICSIFAGRKEEQVILHELGDFSSHKVPTNLSKASTAGLGSIESSESTLISAEWIKKSS